MDDSTIIKAFNGLTEASNKILDRVITLEEKIEKLEKKK